MGRPKSSSSSGASFDPCALAFCGEVVPVPIGFMLPFSFPVLSSEALADDGCGVFDAELGGWSEVPPTVTPAAGIISHGQEALASWRFQ